MSLHKTLSVAAAAMLVAAPAAAHTGAAAGAGLAHGFAHPLGGLDHLLAMVTVGVWAAQRGGRAVWALPAAFVGMMLAGGSLGLSGVALPGVEGAVLASVIVLGAVVALAARPGLPLGLAIVGAFGLFHGQAHGAERPPPRRRSTPPASSPPPRCCTPPASAPPWPRGAACCCAPPAPRSPPRAWCWPRPRIGCPRSRSTFERTAVMPAKAGIHFPEAPGAPRAGDPRRSLWKMGPRLRGGDGRFGRPPTPRPSAPRTSPPGRGGCRSAWRDSRRSRPPAPGRGRRAWRWRSPR